MRVGGPSIVPKVLEHFFAKYSLESPLRQYLLRQAERLEAQKDALKRELAPTLRLKETLDEQVRFCGSTVTVARVALTSDQRCFGRSSCWPWFLGACDSVCEAYRCATRFPL